jgi:hypothetical protein
VSESGNPAQAESWDPQSATTSAMAPGEAETVKALKSPTCGDLGGIGSSGRPCVRPAASLEQAA